MLTAGVAYLSTNAQKAISDPAVAARASVLRLFDVTAMIVSDIFCNAGNSRTISSVSPL